MTNHQLRSVRSGVSRANVVVVVAIIGLTVLLIAPGLVRVHYTDNVRSRCVNNLKQIGLAVHNYASIFENKLPGLVGDLPIQDKKAQVSLYLTLTPYLELDGLYKSALRHPARPEEGDHNGLLVKSIRLSSLLCPADASVDVQGHGKGTSNQLACTSYAPNFKLFGPKVSKYTIEPPDGSSYTIMFAEKYGLAGHVGNYWAIPGSSRFFDPEQGQTYDLPPQLGVPFAEADGGRPNSNHPGASLVLLGDGRVVPLSASIEPSLWKSLVEPEDGGPNNKWEP